jgi:hypothetical protein
MRAFFVKPSVHTPFPYLPSTNLLNTSNKNTLGIFSSRTLDQLNNLPCWRIFRSSPLITISLRAGQGRKLSPLLIPCRLTRNRSGSLCPHYRLQASGPQGFRNLFAYGSAQLFHFVNLVVQHNAISIKALNCIRTNITIFYEVHHYREIYL